MEHGLLPASLTELYLEDFAQPILPNQLPPNLVTLDLGETFNHDITGVLPTSLTTLKLGSSFQQIVAAGTLPESLTDLTWGVSLLSAGVLPQSLKRLAFADYFNEPINITLPPNLSAVAFGLFFDQRIDAGILPSSLTRLDFGYSFSHPLSEDALPASLTHLNVGSSFTAPLNERTLPLSLMLIIIPNLYPHISLLKESIREAVDSGRRAYCREGRCTRHGARWLISPVTARQMIETHQCRMTHSRFDEKCRYGQSGKLIM